MGSAGRCASGRKLICGAGPRLSVARAGTSTTNWLTRTSASANASSTGSGNTPARRARFFASGRFSGGRSKAIRSAASPMVGPKTASSCTVTAACCCAAVKPYASRMSVVSMADKAVRACARAPSITAATRSWSGAISSTRLGGNSRAARRAWRSRSKWLKACTACSGVANTGKPASAMRRRCAAAVVSPMTQVSTGSLATLAAAITASTAAASLGPVGASSTSTPPTSGTAESMAAISATCMGAALPA